MKWAIVLYSIFVINGEPVEHITWQLTFPHHEKCEQFYTENREQILQGVNIFSERKYGTSAVLKELGCAHAVADFDTEIPENPIITLRLPLWQGTSI